MEPFFLAGRNFFLQQFCSYCKEKILKPRKNIIAAKKNKKKLHCRVYNLHWDV